MDEKKDGEVTPTTPTETDTTKVDEITGIAKVTKILEELDKALPKFPDGRIDYSGSNVAPVITVFIKYKDKILLLRRSDRVSTYKRKWNTVAGYLDEIRPIKEKILEELREEIGVGKDVVSLINIGNPFKFEDEKIGKKWIVVPVLVELRKPEIKLNWEHTEYRWIDPKEIKNFETVPNLDLSLKRVLQLQ